MYPLVNSSLCLLLTDSNELCLCRRCVSRLSVRAHDKRIACEEEFSDSEDEAEGQGGGRRNAANHKKAKRVKKEEEKEGEEKKGETYSQVQLVFVDEQIL